MKYWRSARPIDEVIPHEHFIKGHEGPDARAIKRVWLFVFAVALHNLPEGLAIGVGYAGTDAVGAQALATGIAIQDVPEGMVITLALLGIGYRRSFAVTLGVLSGLVEPVMSVVGAGIIGISASLCRGDSRSPPARCCS